MCREHTHFREGVTLVFCSRLSRQQKVAARTLASCPIPLFVRSCLCLSISSDAIAQKGPLIRNYSTHLRALPGWLRTKTQTFVQSPKGTRRYLRFFAFTFSAHQSCPEHECENRRDDLDRSLLLPRGNARLFEDHFEASGGVDDRSA